MLQFDTNEGGASMKESRIKTIFTGIIIGFGTISLSVLFFFILYKIKDIGVAIDRLMQILAPIIYGGVIAYLIRPICKTIHEKIRKYFPKMSEKTADFLSIGLSLLFALLIVYALFAILVPQLYNSIVSIWDTLPDKADTFVTNLETKYSDATELIEFFDEGSAVIYDAVDNWVKNNVMPNLSNIVSNVSMSLWKVLLFLKKYFDRCDHCCLLAWQPSCIQTAGNPDLEPYLQGKMGQGFDR